MPIRLRLALLGMAVAAMAMLVFGWLLDALAGGAGPGDQDRALAALAEQAAEAVRAAPPAWFDGGASPLVTVDARADTEPFVVVRAADGRILFAGGRIDGRAPAVPAALVRAALRDGTARGTVEPAAGAELRVRLRSWARPDLRLTGVAVAGQATRYLDDQRRGMRIFLLVAGGVALLPAAAAIWLVTGRALRPLRALAAAVGEIGRTGDLSRRLPPARTRDEVGALSANFNHMLQRLADAQARLSGALEAQRRFVADASHELRSPLTTIRGNAGFLLERAQVAPADRDEALADIAGESERMARLVDGLLVLARADAGQHGARAPVELAGVVDQAVRRARPRDRGGDVRLELERPVTVTGDADALARLVLILVDNARRHGGGRITVRLATAAGSAVLSVSDRGPGFPDGAGERVFERFYRAAPDRAADGSGLGLAIARSIAGGHGGVIAAANRPEGGAVVTVTLPRG
ncbi:MAG TPA: HAMP domain-containing sensor histidine kinase [Actinomycetes bacterium]|nr:HAMP domain-containing sensor histidine kinase [Actinomycetes bacterium]